MATQPMKAQAISTRAYAEHLGGVPDVSMLEHKSLILKPCAIVTRHLRALALVSTGMAASMGIAAPEPFSCPLALPRTEQSLKEVPEGFSAITADPYPVHELTGFRVNFGPPTKSDGAIYDKDSTTRDAKGWTTETLTWKVAVLEDPYAVCLYRATTQALVRPLTGYQECTVVSRAAPGMQLRMESAACK
ncbi:STY0301 family protein [Roseateles depolymerans]|nr:STY0301 family protein [Roseateles depolymerans]